MDRVAWRATVHGGRKESDMTEQLCTAQHIVKKNNLKQTSGFPCGSVVKNPPAKSGDVRDSVLSLSQEDPLEEGMANHSSILARRIPMDREAQ